MATVARPLNLSIYSASILLAHATLNLTEKALAYVQRLPASMFYLLCGMMCSSALLMPMYMDG
jgi:hypothetical protein